MNDIIKGLLKVTQDVAKLAVEVQIAQHTPVVVVEQRPRNIFDELFFTPRVEVVETRFTGPRLVPRPVRKCSVHTPWQVCEDRNCFHHAGEDRRDMSKLR